MARDSSGNYSLPSGNPVSSNTTISSTTHNTTLADIAEALTDSLSRSGKGGLLAPLTFADGTASSPILAFSDEPSTGIYRNTAGEVNISINGTKVMTISGTALYSEVPHKQLVGGVYADCTDTLDDFTIEGDWDFTGALTLDSATPLRHSDTNLTSGNITFVQGSGPPSAGAGSNGDMIFYYT